MDKLKYIENISSDVLDDKLIALYTSNSVLRQKRRITKAIDKFSEIYPQRNDIHIYSASGRTEIGGNHTDHQHGCVIAAAVNLDVIGVTAFHNDGVVRIKSEGYDAFQISLDDLEIHKDELGTSAIVRGILYKFSKIGNKIGGFDMYITSDILSGSGISSSAGFENLISTALDCYYNDGKIGAIEIAKIGQYAENIYFGKNSGLMDQMVSSVGGFVYIDFKDIENPTIEKIDFNLDNTGYKLIVTDTKGVHKAPANEVVRACTGLSIPFNKGEQDILNPKGVNLIRSFPGQGIRVWGARTTSSDPSWKYINVRRLFIFIEESIKANTNWVVFEPNTPELWDRVQRTINGFLTSLWRSGALAGTSESEAFFCNVDNTTMTKDDIDNGRLICVIGVATVKPAEFVIFKISQKTGE